MLFSPRYLNTKKIQKRYKNTVVSFLLASVILAGFFVHSSVNAATGINKQVSFQGKVVNNDGTNTANGSYTFLFCIYTTASPTTACTAGANNDAVWRESKSLTVTDGIFQTNLGDTTTLPGSVDFNTDNIYLGINFNADGQMSPLVRFTAAPYAMNAKTVGGLTVTDTTGTLTIPSGKTVSFADAFTTSGAFPLTLTSTASTTATLPSGTITLVDLATSQSLTNKTIGSTGLTFSGATTDITTGTGEDLTLVANGAGIISLNDAVTIANALTANGGISLSGSQSLSAAALAYVDLGLIVHNSTANQGLRLPQAASATPSNPTSGEGYLAWDAAGNQLITYNGSAWTTVGGSIAADSLNYTDFADSMTLDANLALAQTAFTWAQTFTGTTTTGFSYAADSLTSGTAFSINSAAAAFTGSLSDITLSGSNAANTGTLLAVNNTGTSNANTSLYIKHYATGTNNLAFRVDDVSGDTTPFVIDGTGNVGIGDSTPDGILDFDYTSTNATAGTEYGANFMVSDTGIVTTGTDTTYGNYLSTTRTGATGGTINTYGNYTLLTTDNAGAGTSTAYGSYIDTGTAGATNADTVYGLYINTEANAGTAYGLYVDVGAQAGTEYSGIFMNGNFGIGDATPDALLDLDFSQTSGTLYGVAAPSGVTLAGALTGLSLNLSTNVTATGQSVTGSTITLPAVTNTGAGTYNYQGLTVTGGAITQNTGAGTDTFNGIAVTNSNLTQTTGTLTSNGLSVTTGSITTGGTQSGLNITASGVGSGGLLYGVNISYITPGAGGEIAVGIGSGWDTGVNIGSSETGNGILMDVWSKTSGNGVVINGSWSGANTNFTGSLYKSSTNRTVSTGSVTDTGSHLNLSRVNATNNAAGTFIVSGDLATLYSTSSVSGGTMTDSSNILSLAQNCGTGATCSGSVFEVTNAGTGNSADFLMTNASGTQTNGFYLNRTGAGTTTNAININEAAGTITNGIVFSSAFSVGLDAGSNTIENIGNTGTDFIASTGALTLAGVLTANGGISLSGSQSITAAALAYVDLGLITHSSTANQGLRLPQAASATPSNPTSGEGYLAWDAAGNQLITYNGSSWTTVGSASIAADSLNYTDFADSMTLDANLTLAQTTFTWAQTFTGDTTTGLTYTADSLTSGKALAIASGATAFTGSLANITLSGSNASNTGTLLAIDNTGTLNTNTSLYIKHYATGTNNLAMRVDDVSGDTTPFVIDGAGNVGIGDVTPDALLDLDFSRTSGNLFQIEAPTLVTTTSLLQGQYINLGVNISSNNFSVSGTSTVLPVVTNSGAGTYSYIGTQVSGNALNQNTAAGVTTFVGTDTYNSNITQTTGTVSAIGSRITIGTITTGGTQYGYQILAAGVGAGTLYGVSISGITAGAGTETAISVGSGWDTGIDLNANTLVNIGNAGTDFVASTGALTLAGVLTANGGVTLAGSQAFTASALSYMDLGAITHGSTAVQGLRLPQAASATPSNPTSGEGYLAWDAAGNQLITYNGSSWTTLSGGSMAIGGAITSATLGSVLFAGTSGNLTQDNANFFWDDTNNTLRIGGGTNVTYGTPTAVPLDIGGTVNTFLQANIQNKSTGTGASTDWIATADNGTDSTNYVDMGINGSGYTGGVFGGANDAYLYNLGQDLLVGTGTSGKALQFLTGGTTEGTNTRASFSGAGNFLMTGGDLAYTNNIGLFNVTNTTNFTGVAGETGMGIQINPAFTLTEPGSGLYMQYGQSIDMSSIAVTAGAGTSEISGMRIIGNTDVDATTVEGLDIANTTATAANQIAINIGTGWDTAINANGKVVINGTDSSVVRTTTGTGTATTDFGQSGAVFTNVTNANDQIELNDGTGATTISSTLQPASSGTIGAGSMSILRSDGKYLVLIGGSSLATSVYDPIAKTFTAGSTLTAGNSTLGVGGIALPRANGQYMLINGQGSTAATSLFDPLAMTSAAGPTLNAAITGAGTVAFKRPDGRYLITNGAAAGTTQLYDPVSNATLVAGPTNSGGATWAAGALVLSRPNGDALFVTGGATATTHAYTSMTGTIAGVSAIGSFAAGPALPTGCEINGAGSVAIRKQDGKYIILSKINVAAVYDPTANLMSQLKGSCTTPTSGMGPTVALADGAHALPLQDGRFLIIHGGALTSTTIYDPSTDTFSSGPTITAGGAGRHSVINPDGTWQLIAGGGTATDNLNTGLVTEGVYQSDDISITTLNENSTVRWLSQFEVPFTGLTTGAGGATAFTATQSAGGGSCTAGVHSYRVTFTINGIETLGGPASNEVTCSGGTDKVVLTNVPIGPAGTTARKIYRSGNASAAVVKYQLVNGGSPTCVLTDNTSTTCTDTLADASLTTTLATGAGAVQSATSSTMRFFVRTAVNSSGCTTPLDAAFDREVQNSGDYIRPGSTDNCVRITVKFNRPISKRIIDDRGTFFGNGSTTTRLDYVTPTLSEIALDNSTILRRNAGDFNFSAASWNNPGTSPAPTALTAGAPSSGGSCTAGTHSYKVTYVMSATATSALAPYTESLPGAASNFVTCTGPNGTVALSSIPTGPTGTTARKIYRTLAGDASLYYLLTTINDNSATTYNDTSADASLGMEMPGYDPSGPVMTRVETQNDKLVLPYGQLPTTTLLGTNGYYQGSPPMVGPSIPQAQTNEGTIVIARPNRTFKVIASLTTPAANAVLYDPGSNSFSAAQSGVNIPTASNGIGGFALKRPDGKFLVVLGNLTGTTNIYDPVADTFTVGPSLSQSAVAGCGAMAIPNTDGTYTLLHGSSSAACAVSAVVTTSVYDPVRNTIVAGPTTTLTVNSGSWAIPMQYPGRHIYKVWPGNPSATIGVATTMNYDAAAKTFSAGTNLASVHGAGSIVFQREDGNWVSICGEAGTAGAGLATTNIINPVNGVSVAGPSLTGLMKRGTHVIPRPDGTYLVVQGNLTTSYIYIPKGGAFSAGVGDIGLAGVSGPTFVTVGPGALSFQRPDGKWMLINGNATAATQIVDVGWFADGQYLSDQMQVPALSANSTIDWKQTPDNYVRMEARTASSQAALSTAAYTSIGKPGQSMFNAGGETWMQVEINMRRDFPSFGGTMTDVYLGSSGMIYATRPITFPTVMSYQINNGQDLLTLQTNGSNMMRVTSNGNIYSSAMGGFFSGGADLAENYTSNDSLQKGEIVAVDSTDAHNVKRSTRSYQTDLLGVVSTEPGFVAGAYTEDSYPIALVGRVPVNVTTESGMILAGQRITSASLPGYGMKAVGAGRVIGVALQSMDEATLTDCPAENGGMSSYRCGQIMVFVNLADYTGASVSDMVAALGGDDKVTYTAALGFTDHSIFTGYTSSLETLGFLKHVSNPGAEVALDVNSEIFAKNINASGQIVSPLIVTDTLLAKHIKAESIEGLEIYTDQLSSLSEKYAALARTVAAQPVVPETETVTTPVDGEVLPATTPAPTIKDITLGNTRIGLSLQVIGKLTADGGMVVSGDATFNGNTLFNQLASFFGATRFLGQVSFEQAPQFGSDTAGFAVIAKGERRVRVTFAEPYEKQPIVTATLTNDQSPLLDETADETLKADVAAVEDDFLTHVFDADIRYVVTEKGSDGFTLVLNKEAPYDLQFSWVAFAVKKSKTFLSEPTNKETPVKEDVVDPVTEPVEDNVVPLSAIAPAAVPIEALPVETPLVSSDEVTLPKN